MRIGRPVPTSRASAGLTAAQVACPEHRDEPVTPIRRPTLVRIVVMGSSMNFASTCAGASRRYPMKLAYPSRATNALLTNCPMRGALALEVDISPGKPTGYYNPVRHEIDVRFQAMYASFDSVSSGAKSGDLASTTPHFDIGATVAWNFSL
jgi:hypothetical protein